MGALYRTLHGLLATYAPIRPALAESVRMLNHRRRALAILICASLAASVALGAAAEHAWFQLLHSYDRQTNEQLDQFGKSLRLKNVPHVQDAIPERWPSDADLGRKGEVADLMQLLLAAPIYHEAVQMALYSGIIRAMKFTTLGLLIVFVYVAVCRQATASPSTGSAASSASRTAQFRIALVASAMLFAPALMRNLMDLLGNVSEFTFDSDPFHNGALRRLASWHVILDTAWFAIAAPFLLPAVPISLRAGAPGALAASARLGGARFLRLSALISIAAGPLLILDWMVSRSAFRLVHELDIFDWDGVVDRLLAGLPLAAVGTTAIIIGTYVGSRIFDPSERQG
jgi:hypothetical protein